MPEAAPEDLGGVMALRLQQILALGRITMTFETLDFMVGELILGFTGSPTRRYVDGLTAGKRVTKLEQVSAEVVGPARQLLDALVGEYTRVIHERVTLIHGAWRPPVEGEPLNGPAFLWRGGSRLQRPPRRLNDFATDVAGVLDMVTDVGSALQEDASWHGPLPTPQPLR